MPNAIAAFEWFWKFNGIPQHRIVISWVNNDDNITLSMLKRDYCEPRGCVLYYWLACRGQTQIFDELWPSQYHVILQIFDFWHKFLEVFFKKSFDFLFFKYFLWYTFFNINREKWKGPPSIGLYTCTDPRNRSQFLSDFGGSSSYRLVKHQNRKLVGFFIISIMIWQIVVFCVNNFLQT